MRARRTCRRHTVSILRIEDKDGNIFFENPPSIGAQVIRPEHTYLLSSILSDQSARRLVFGRDSILDLPFQAAVKTGTTNDFRDNWTIGYTPDVAVGVWVGNADYTAMQGTTGLTGAAPIWSSVMQQVVQRLTNNSPSTFTRPGGIVEHQICRLSGTFPGRDCEEQVTEVFAIDQPPLPKEEDLLQEVSPTNLEGVKIVGADEVKAVLGQKGVYVFDMRKALNYGKGHLQGAVSLPFKWTVENDDPIKRQGEFDKAVLPQDKNAKIIFHSDGPSGWKSYYAAKMTKEAGYKNVMWYRGGFDDWSTKGYPLGN